MITMLPPDAIFVFCFCFLQPSHRANATFDKRLASAYEEHAVGPTCHVANCDEDEVPAYAGQFHKSLPHDEYGQVSNGAQ